MCEGGRSIRGAGSMRRRLPCPLAPTREHWSSCCLTRRSYAVTTAKDVSRLWRLAETYAT